jgi:hypothetical protein
VYLQNNTSSQGADKQRRLGSILQLHLKDISMFKSIINSAVWQGYTLQNTALRRKKVVLCSFDKKKTNILPKNRKIET